MIKKYLINTVIIENLNGFKIDDLDGLKSFFIPKKLLKKVGNLNEKENIGLRNSGIYFLINKEDKYIYIGQTNDLYKRLLEHNRNSKIKKNGIIVAITTDSNWLSKTFIDYLEYHYIQKYKSNEYWILDNKDNRERIPNIGMHEQIKIDGIISKIDIILRLNEVDPKKNYYIYNNNQESEKNLFFYKNAKVIYDNEYLMLLKGSKIYNLTDKKIWKNNFENFSNKEYKNKLYKILDYKNQFLEKNWIKIINEDECIILKNIKLKSPKLCACLISGDADTDGWIVFKNKNGLSLSEFIKK